MLTLWVVGVQYFVVGLFDSHRADLRTTTGYWKGWGLFGEDVATHLYVAFATKPPGAGDEVPPRGHPSEGEIRSPSRRSAGRGWRLCNEPGDAEVTTRRNVMIGRARTVAGAAIPRWATAQPSPIPSLLNCSKEQAPSAMSVTRATFSRTVRLGIRL